MNQIRVLFLFAEPFLVECAAELTAKMKPEGILPLSFRDGLEYLKMGHILKAIAFLEPVEGEAKVVEYGKEIRAIDPKTPVVVIATRGNGTRLISDPANPRRVQDLIGLIKTTVGHIAWYVKAS